MLLIPLHAHTFSAKLLLAGRQGNNVESTSAVAKWITGPGCAITVTSSAVEKTNDDDRDDPLKPKRRDVQILIWYV